MRLTLLVLVLVIALSALLGGWKWGNLPQSSKSAHTAAGWTAS